MANVNVWVLAVDRLAIYLKDQPVAVTLCMTPELPADTVVVIEKPQDVSGASSIRCDVDTGYRRALRILPFILPRLAATELDASVIDAAEEIMREAKQEYMGKVGGLYGAVEPSDMGLLQGDDESVSRVTIYIPPDFHILRFF